MGSARDKGRRQLAEMARAFDAGRSVVVDNTNATVADRAPLIALAHARGARAIGYEFRARVEECVARNRRREGKARVPDAAIFVTAMRLEPPSLDEGFDELFRVRVAGDR